MIFLFQTKLKSGWVILITTLLAMAAQPQNTFAAGAGQSTYEVPKSNLLETPLIVDLKKARLHIKGDSAVLDYRFPMELDGTDPIRLVMSGTFDGTHWNLSTSPESARSSLVAATAVCDGDEREFTCRMTYAKDADGLFHINTESADAYLNTRTDLTAEQITHIKSAQFALSHEPIGIIRVRR